MLCRRHHRAVHEEGYQIQRLPTGDLEFKNPYGLVIADVPPSPVLPTDSAGVIRAQNEANGLALDAQTTMPDWLGERLDVGYAIDVLHPRAIDERRRN